MNLYSYNREVPKFSSPYIAHSFSDTTATLTFTLNSTDKQKQISLNFMK